VYYFPSTTSDIWIQRLRRIKLYSLHKIWLALFSLHVYMYFPMAVLPPAQKYFRAGKSTPPTCKLANSNLRGTRINCPPPEPAPPHKLAVNRHPRLASPRLAVPPHIRLLKRNKQTPMSSHRRFGKQIPCDPLLSQSRSAPFQIRDNNKRPCETSVFLRTDFTI
jgi:hypothetical protein